MAEDTSGFQERMARDLGKIENMLTQVVNYMVEAESEIPEKMRRFMMYMHDVRDVMQMYHETGQTVPEYINAEMRRLDDRYRQLLQDLHTDTGTFEKVRQEMTKREGNKWEHGRILQPPMKETNELPSQPDSNHGGG